MTDAQKFINLCKKDEKTGHELWQTNDDMKEVYKRITNEPKFNMSANVKRSIFRSYLVKRYKGPVAAFLVDLIDLTIPIKVDIYWKQMEELLNIHQERLFELAF